MTVREAFWTWTGLVLDASFDPAIAKAALFSGKSNQSFDHRVVTL